MWCHPGALPQLLHAASLTSRGTQPTSGAGNPWAPRGPLDADGAGAPGGGCGPLTLDAVSGMARLGADQPPAPTHPRSSMRTTSCPTERLIPVRSHRERGGKGIRGERKQGERALVLGVRLPAVACRRPRVAQVRQLCGTYIPKAAHRGQPPATRRRRPLRKALQRPRACPAPIPPRGS